MQLSKPTHASDQVAALLGVTPAAVDGGEPVQLALNKVDPTPAVPSVKAAQAAPAPAPAPVQVPAKPVAISLAAPVAPMPVQAPVVAVAPAPPPPRSTLATLADSAVTEAKAVLAAVLPHHSAPAAKPHRVAATFRPATRRGNSQVVVQLGAYGSPDRVLAGWNHQARKYGALKAYLPMSARFASPKGVFYRLSVRGFDSVGQATSLCNSLRRSGGSCYVRNFAGDTPVQYASR